MGHSRIIYSRGTKLELRKGHTGGSANCEGKQLSGCTKKPVMKLSDDMMDMDSSGLPSTSTSKSVTSPTPSIFFSSGSIDASHTTSTVSSRSPAGTADGTPSSTSPSPSSNSSKSDSSQKENDDSDSNDGNDSDSDDNDDDDDDDDDDKGDNGSKNSNGSNSDNNDSSSKGPSFNNSANNGPPNLDPSCQLINDNDGRLQYTGAWTLDSKDPNGLYFTSHTTSTADSQVSITFNGTSVTVVGVVHASNSTNPPAAASYTIDSYPPIALPLPFTSRDIPNQAFFESEELPLSAHKLTINVTTNGSPYILNSLTVCNKATNPVVALAPGSRPAAGPNIPLIVGASIVSGFIAVILAVVGFVLYRRRKRGAVRLITRYPVLSWLRRGTPTPMFTSTESILRNNPTNPSTVDPFDKLERAEKESGREVVPPFPLSELTVATKSRPSTPVSALKAMPDSPILPASLSTSLTLRFDSDRPESLVSCATPTFTLSDRLPRSSDPEGHFGVPPHPSFLVQDIPRPL